jgi:hypothetical protein
MVNNFTNINKTNNHPSPQPNEHNKTTTIFEVGNLTHGLRQAQQCVGVKPVNVMDFNRSSKLVLLMTNLLLIYNFI